MAAGGKATGTSTHQGRNVLDERDVLVVGSEEKVFPPRSQDTQQQCAEHHRIHREVGGRRADV